MVDSERLVERYDGNYRLTNGSFAERYELCEDAPFFDQPSAPHCSGFLVDEDLFVTAGHCVPSGCDDFSIVFDYAHTNGEAPRAAVPKENVYRCSEFVVNIDEDDNDFALIRLDRPVTGRSPVKIAAEFPAPGTSGWTRTSSAATRGARLSTPQQAE